MKEYIFRDPIHGNIAVTDPTIFALIQSPEFQRLRRIRQLGTSFISYPGAEHTRFAHSLGVYHLMNRVLRHLVEHGVQIDPDLRAMACAAALLHDIGHGPFSHLFEKVTGMRHEDWVVRIIAGPDSSISRILADRNLAWPARIASFVSGTWDGPPFLKELISSQLDVDRMDYLLRDSRMCGVTYGQFDLERLIQTITVVDGRVVLTDKGITSAEEFLLARYFMYWNVYFHKATRSSEVLLELALRRAVALVREGAAEELGFLPPALEPVLAGRELSLSQYLALDETDVLYAVKRWTQAPDPVLADLSLRFLNRHLFAGIRLDGELTGPREEAVRAALAAAGFDPDYYHRTDRAAAAAYQYYVRPEQGSTSPIQILLSWTVPPGLREVTEVSAVLRGIATQPVTRCFLFVPREAAAAVRRALLEN
ncbi:HD domain-containing protein [Symbiobacterium terraclitae]|uniref:HD domain-containing protein n=1 Tax=Symbiobacterium terraclitae TaxID=557451 RepID=UPI0035B554EE